MKITLGFSPCPNDTFIFDALVNHKIDTKGLSFEVLLDDVQTLNQWAMEEKLMVSKISYGVLPQVLNTYAVLNSGGALGKGVGPLLISRFPPPANVEEAVVAIPGQNTTAHLLFSLAYPQASKKYFTIFHEIEKDVLTGKADAGVIIHENRFTYQAKGLHKIVDLGNYWEQTTGLPIPLGGIIAHKSLSPTLVQTIDALIQQSVQFAFNHYPLVTNYVKQHAQEMEESVMRQHIDLYVNHYSESLGISGQDAVMTLLKIYQNLHDANLPLPDKQQVFWQVAN